jgi:hypothetical protein
LEDVQLCLAALDGSTHQAAGGRTFFVYGLRPTFKIERKLRISRHAIIPQSIGLKWANLFRISRNTRISD